MLEWKDFEEMFGAKEGVVLKDSGKQAEKKPDLISVVDAKKAYNCCKASFLSSIVLFSLTFFISSSPSTHVGSSENDKCRGEEGDLVHRQGKPAVRQHAAPVHELRAISRGTCLPEAL